MRTASTIGFIGLGAMGAPMAANLQKAGWRLVVHDVRREAAAPHLQTGAVWADTPRALAAQSDVVFSCLPDPEAIERVVLGADGVLAGLRAGGALFELSTSTPALVKRLHAAFSQRAQHFLDAPISGGVGAAQRARLAIWVGGDGATYHRWQPALRAMGDRPLHVGAVGAGTVTTLVHNCIDETTRAAIAEIFTMGVKAGADPLGLWEGVRLGMIGRRRTLDDLVDEFLPGDYERIQAPLSVVYKDMKSATGFARELGVPFRYPNLAFADIQEAMNRGWAARDRRIVMLLPQERVGVRIQVHRSAIADVLRRDPPAPSDVKHGEGA